MRIIFTFCPIVLFVTIFIVQIDTVSAQVPAISGTTYTNGTREAGASMTIFGSNFNTSAANNILFLGSVKATITSASSTSISATIPYGSTSQPISLLNTANKLTGYSSGSFYQSFTPTSNIGSYTFDPLVPLEAGQNPYSVAICDINNDGKPDLLVANSADDTFSILKSRGSVGAIGSASFESKINFGIGSAASDIEVGDLNGDGLPDIVIGYQKGNFISVFINTSTAGNVSFATRQDYTAAESPSSVAIGDIDSDGKPDIVTANSKRNTISIIRNNTNASGVVAFSSRVDYGVAAYPNNVVIADMNKDGKPDILVTNFQSKTISTLKNISSSTTTINSTTLAPRYDISVAGSPTAIAVGDVNNDPNSMPEIVVTLYSNTKNAVAVINNLMATNGDIAAGSYGTPVEFTTGSEPMSVALADIDGNLKPDIIVANYNAKTVSVLKNTEANGTISSGSFAAKVDFPVGDIPVSVKVADLDADKFPDIAVACLGDNTVSILHTVNTTGSLGPAGPESTASISQGSFINTDIYDSEWALDAPVGYTIATHNGVTINSGGNAPANAGRFVYFATMGTTSPVQYIQGNLQFSAKGSGTIEVQLITTWNMQVYARKTFVLTSAYQDYSWVVPNIYPQNEYMFAVMFNGGNSSVQASGEFRKNMTFTLQQGGMSGFYKRFRADNSSLIGNVETAYGGYSDQYNLPRKKYLQHSAYSRMRFTTDATKLLIEYVRDSYDKQTGNLFTYNGSTARVDFDGQGNIIPGNHTITTQLKIESGKTYTISGLKTQQPVYVWYNSSSQPLGAPQSLTNVSPGTAQNPLYQITAPSGAVSLGLLIQRVTEPGNYTNPLNDLYTVYTNCTMLEGTVAALTAGGATIPYTPYVGSVPSKISGPAIFVNGKLYNYLQVEGNDIAKRVSYVADVLPPGTKTVEVMMNGQGTYSTNGVTESPSVRRSGNYLRAVYLPADNTTVLPATTKAENSILYIHDSILSGFNISQNSQNNVWMMKIKNDPALGFKGDVFSEGYAGRILYTDVNTDAKVNAFADKLIAFGVKNYWFQVGVNDFGFITPLHEYYDKFNKLVERMKSLQSDLKIYIQSIGPSSYQGPNGETYADNGLESTGPEAKDFMDVQRAIATAPGHSYCEYVDFEGLFPPTIDNVPDGIHPNDSGNALYAKGIKDKSTLLGTVMPVTPLEFYRTAIRQFIKSVRTVSIITARGGKAPYTFSTTSYIPNGLFFNANGVITGVAQESGTFPISVQVQDANGTIITKTFDLIVKPTPTIIVAPMIIPQAQTGVAYSKTLKSYGGYGKYNVAASGSLPPGLNYNAATGELSGTPTTAGTYQFTITATDHWGFTGSTTYNFMVGTGTPPPMSDKMTMTATVDASGRILITPEMHDIYTQDIFGWFNVSYKPTGGTFTPLKDGNLVVKAGALKGPTVQFESVPSVGDFVLKVGGGYTMAPTNVDNKNLTSDSETLFNLTFGTPQPIVYDPWTTTGSANSSNQVFITGQVQNIYNTGLYAYCDVFVKKNNVEYWLKGLNIVISPGNTTSGSVLVDTAPVAKPYQIKIKNYGIQPTSAGGRTFSFVEETFISVN